MLPPLWLSEFYSHTTGPKFQMDDEHYNNLSQGSLFCQDFSDYL